MRINEDRKLRKVFELYKYALQAALEAPLPESIEEYEEYKTLIGLHLQSELTRLQEMDDEELEKELSFFTTRPINKISGIIL